MSENDNLQEADGNKELKPTETPQTPENSNTESEQISEEISIQEGIR